MTRPGSHSFAMMMIAASDIPLVLFNVTGGGAGDCNDSLLPVGLDGSTLGVDYLLYQGPLHIGTVPGTGAALDFGDYGVGTYTVVAQKGATTKVMTGNAVITVPPALGGMIGSTPPLCFGGTGSIYITAFGGHGNYQYSSNGGLIWQDSPSFSLLAGTYNCRIRDKDYPACVATIDPAFVLTQPTRLLANAGGTAECCVNDLPITLVGSSSGGTSPVGKVWSGPGVTPPNLFTPGMPTGTRSLTLTATDANLCVGVDNLVMNVKALPVDFNVTGGDGCTYPGVTIGLDGSTNMVLYELFKDGLPTGSTFDGNGAPISFGLKDQAGVYTIRATTGQNCRAFMTGSVTIVQSPAVSCPVNFACCIDEPQMDLSGMATPLGGVYSGDGVADPYFTAADAGLGSHTIVYTYTDPITLCSAVCNFNIMVNVMPIVYSMTGADSCDDVGSVIGLDGSENMFLYRLYKNGSPTLITVDGTGLPISFGLITDPGVYTVLATNQATTCATMMTGSVTVTPVPDIAFNVTGGGNGCASTGVPIGLDGSQLNVSYEACLGGVPQGITADGTGAAISLGSMTSAGTWTIKGTNICGTLFMTGSAIVTLDPDPALYNFTGSDGCTDPGVTFGLDDSDLNVTYTLYKDGSPTANVLAGTGAALDFGLVTVAGIYTCVAADDVTACELEMSRTWTIAASPAVTCGPDINKASTDPAFSLARPPDMPNGGVYSGDHVALGEFDVPGAGIGIHTVIYTYTHPLTLCSKACSFNVNVT